MLQNFIDIIAAPRAAFTRIREKPTILLPLLVIIAMSVAVQFGYYFLNDEGFVKDELIEQQINILDANNEQSAQIEQNVTNQSITALAVPTAIALAVGIPLIMSLMAWYLSFMSKFSFSQLTFKYWFSLQCWTSIPQIFAALASLIILLTDANGQVSQTNLQPLSFSALLGTDNPALQQVNLTQIWSLVLLSLGYQQWTKKSLVSSILITWAPTVILLGGSALLFG